MSVAALCSSLVHLDLGECYRRLGDLDRAHECLQRAQAGIGALGDDDYGKLIRGGLSRLTQQLAHRVAPRTRAPRRAAMTGGRQHLVAGGGWRVAGGGEYLMVGGGGWLVSTWRWVGGDEYMAVGGRGRVVVSEQPSVAGTVIRFRSYPGGPLLRGASPHFLPGGSGAGLPAANPVPEGGRDTGRQIRPRMRMSDALESIPESLTSSARKGATQYLGPPAPAGSPTGLSTARGGAVEAAADAADMVIVHGGCPARRPGPDGSGRCAARPTWSARSRGARCSAGEHCADRVRPRRTARVRTVERLVRAVGGTLTISLPTRRRSGVDCRGDLRTAAGAARRPAGRRRCRRVSGPTSTSGRCGGRRTGRVPGGRTGSNLPPPLWPLRLPPAAYGSRNRGYRDRRRMAERVRRTQRSAGWRSDDAAALDRLAFRRRAARTAPCSGSCAPTSVTCTWSTTRTWTGHASWYSTECWSRSGHRRIGIGARLRWRPWCSGWRSSSASAWSTRWSRTTSAAALPGVLRLPGGRRSSPRHVPGTPDRSAPTPSTGVVGHLDWRSPRYLDRRSPGHLDRRSPRPHPPGTATSARPPELRPPGAPPAPRPLGRRRFASAGTGLGRITRRTARGPPGSGR